MNISRNGIEFIKKEEGLVLNAYLCPANVWTIGYGHTNGVKKGDKITEEQAEDFLVNDLLYSERIVNKMVKVKLNQNQYDALVSFVFNVGSGNFINSTLLKKLNAGAKSDEICVELRRWIFSKGKKLPVLVARRQRECELYQREE